MNETDSKFSDSLIKEELARVCSSKELKPKYRLCSLLEYLVTEKLSGREVKEETGLKITRSELMYFSEIKILTLRLIRLSELKWDAFAGH